MFGARNAAADADADLWSQSTSRVRWPGFVTLTFKWNIGPQISSGHIISARAVKSSKLAEHPWATFWRIENVKIAMQRENSEAKLFSPRSEFERVGLLGIKLHETHARAE